MKRQISLTQTLLKFQHPNPKTIPIPLSSSPIHPLKKPQTESNSKSYNTLSKALQDCLHTRDIRLGSSVHAQLIKHYSNLNVFVSLWNKLLNFYSKCNNLQVCRKLFDKMPQRDVVSYNTLMSMYVRNIRGITEAVGLYSGMRLENVTPNHITLATLIGVRSVLELRFIEAVHGQAIVYGVSSNEFVGSSLVDGYAKRGRLKESLCAFEEISTLDLVSWNIMIDGCVRNGSDQNALKIFLRMRKKGVDFDGFTLSSVIKTCSEPRDLEKGLQFHCCAIKVGLEFETPINNALITMYSKCEKRMVSSVKIFEETAHPDIISWTAMLAGFMQNGMSEDAITFYLEMLRLGVKENEFSFSSILPAYSSLGKLEQGIQVHARIIKSSFQFDVSVGNALVDMYFKCGSLFDAELAFRTMERHDAVSWTVMVTGLGQHGKAMEAVVTLKEMISKGMKPDRVTYLAALSACNHGGLVDEGLEIFRYMIDVHRVKPGREHYGCVADMFGRSGRLEEAEKFILDMGIGLDVLAWEALLSACRIHGEMKLGERVALKIMEMEPKNDGPYALLANLYAEKGLWEDKSMVRESLDVGAGNSWVAS